MSNSNGSNINNIIKTKESEVINKYKKVAIDMLSKSFPFLTDSQLEKAVEYSIEKRYKEFGVKIDNNYKKVTLDSTILELTDYILKKKPIITSYGVMFKQSSVEMNPVAKLMEIFLANREKNKKLMYTYPIGSEMFEKYNLFQLLDKIDANGLYGALGQAKCLVYNIYIASTTTSQAKTLVSSAGLQFEMFLANNCKFCSLNEVITFIHNIINEKHVRKYKDSVILDKPVTVQDCFVKLIMTCGFLYVPDERDMNIIWDILIQLSQDDINRIYYKNNLYQFMENKFMQDKLVSLLTNLNSPFLNPNVAPPEIKDDLNIFTDILMEYVYYKHQLIDKVDRYANMYRSVCVLTDTDSTIISLDAWYNYTKEKIKGLDLKINRDKIKLFERGSVDEFGDVVKKYKIFKNKENEKDYDFINDKIVYKNKKPKLFKPVTKDGLRQSCVNIISYVLSKVIEDYMLQFCKKSFSRTEEETKCFIVMKNEYLFKRMLLTSGRRTYANLQELKEGHIVPPDSQLDIKGLPLSKSGTPITTQKTLKKMVYDILTRENVSQLDILKDLCIFENTIITQIKNGSKEYFKPSSVKPQSSYSDPMRVDIKSCIVYNKLKDDNKDSINLDDFNVVLIVKLNINKKNISTLKDKYPDKYEKVVELLKDKYYEKGINKIALPKDVDLPEWLFDYVDYTTIISDNLRPLPIESIGLYRGRDSYPYTNIVQF